MLSLLDPVVALLHSALTHLSAVLPVSRDLSVVLALVLLTAALRAALLPLSLRTHRATESKKALAPEIARIQKRFGKDHKRLAQELTAAYRTAGVKPMAGMGPMLLQMPVPTLLYRLVTTTAVAGQANVLASTSVLGTPLSSHWLPALSAASGGPMLLFALLMAGLLLVAYLHARQATEGPRGVRLLPYGAVVGAALSPVAFAVYLLTSTTWSLAERAILPRLA